MGGMARTAIRVGDIRRFVKSKPDSIAHTKNRESILLRLEACP